MRSVLLPGTNTSVSRLSFGTASLHHLASRRDAARLLCRAVELGFTHFDTAPYYGFGFAEEALGALLRGHRDALTVASKIGLYPPVGSSPALAGVFLRKMAGRIWPAVSRPHVNWSVDQASASLDRTLRRLGRGHVDFLFLHEPGVSLIAAEPLLAWLERVRAEGKIRHWGVAGDLTAILPWLREASPLAQVVQVRDSIGRREADAVIAGGRPLQFTYGYLSASSAHDPLLPRPALLRAALNRNSTGSVIVSTGNQSHLAELASAAEVSWS